MRRGRREELARDMLRSGQFPVSPGSGDRVARAVECLAEAELRSVAARLMVHDPGLTADQFARLAWAAYDVVSRRVAGEDGWFADLVGGEIMAVFREVGYREEKLRDIAKGNVVRARRPKLPTRGTRS